MKHKDKCIVCWNETEYEEDTPIQERHFYIEGCGQLCEKCYLAVQQEEMQMKKSIK